MWEVINEKKRVVLFLFIIGLVIGTLVANSLNNDILSQVAILNRFFFEKYTTTNIDYGKLFKIVCLNRLVPVIVFMVIGATGIGIYLMYISILYFGFIVGFIVSASVIKFGIMGLALNFAYQFPHLLIYVAATILLYYKLYRIYQDRKVNEYNNTLSSYVVVCVIIIFIYFIGILVETFMNPSILKIFIERFLSLP